MPLFEHLRALRIADVEGGEIVGRDQRQRVDASVVVGAWLFNSNRLFRAESVFVTFTSAGRFFASKSTKYVSRQR